MPSSSANSSPLSVSPTRIHLANIRSGMADFTPPSAFFTLAQSCAFASRPSCTWQGRLYSVRTACASALRPIALSSSVRAALASSGSLSNSAWLRFRECEVGLRSAFFLRGLKPTLPASVQRYMVGWLTPTTSAYSTDIS